MRKDNLLIEVGCEELPPKALNNLANAFKNGVTKELQERKLPFGEVEVFATPRRLALLINQLPERQEDFTNERRGPSVDVGMKEGKPTPALEGFARSCGATVDQLVILETDRGAWYTFSQSVVGETLAKMLPEIVDKALKSLPIPKRMRWADNDFEFVRPVRWLVALYGADLIEMELFNIKATNQTRGHRFHTHAPITIDRAENYESILKTQGHVIPNAAERKASIQKQIDQVTQPFGRAIVNEGLLDEVTALVEWPVALVGSFEAHFLNVPQEALIIAMEDHQRYFPIVDQAGKLINHFCFIANIESSEPEAVIDGNERVIRPRFADTEFFWEEDLKTKLDDYFEPLQSVIFQADLGTQADKIERVSQLALSIVGQIANQKNIDSAIVERSARLNKSDLISNMVQEFPELQGTMARYYAEHQGEPQLVADSLEQVYWPRFAGDKLPESIEAQVLAIAERLDTIVGIFAIGEIPTGSRDPFGLRRNALAILRTVIEKQLPLDLMSMIDASAASMPTAINAEKSIETIFTYIIERMKAYSADLGVPADTFESVIALPLTNPLDIYNRLLAVTEFKKLPEAVKLIHSNRRIHNILERNQHDNNLTINPALFENDAEKDLHQAVTSLASDIEGSVAKGDYQTILTTLANLAEPLEAFFESTMVMADDLSIRNNRIALLVECCNLFEFVADISKLQLDQ